MPTRDDLSKLFAAVACQDWATARSVGTKIADAEEKRGHHAAAQQLRGALSPNVGRSNGTNGHHSAVLGDVGLLSSALTRLEEGVPLQGVALRPSIRRDLESVVAEWKHRAALAERGVALRRKLLFHGPPGCGKTLTARALGAELGLPVFVVRIDAVIGAFLGQTALRIRELFAFAERTACVLLLDEIDALGKRRGSNMDVGELDRVVISLMQELEHTAPKGLVVGTSNLQQHLDDALHRRFDLVIRFPGPTRNELLSFAKLKARERGISLPSRFSQRISSKSSYADVARQIDDAERATILAEITRARK